MEQQNAKHLELKPEERFKSQAPKLDADGNRILPAGVTTSNPPLMAPGVPGTIEPKES